MSDYNEKDPFLDRENVTENDMNAARSDNDEVSFGRTDEDRTVDGTYRYSYRQADENPEEYRRPPYMRDEIGSSQKRYYDEVDSPTSGGSAGSGSQNTEYDRYRYSDDRQSSGDSRYSYSDDRQNPGDSRYSYSEDNRNSSTGRSYQNDSYRYDNSQGGSRRPRKQGNAGKIVAVLAGALILGAIIGGACWSLGGLVSSSGSRSASGESQIAMQPTLESQTEAPGEQEDQTAEQPSAGESQASSDGNTGGEAAIASGESREGSQVLIQDVSDVVDIALPSVVAITTTSVYEYYNSYGYNPFDPFGSYGSNGGSNTYEVQGAGSGIIIGDDGSELWIVTNNHVVEGSETLTVNFCDDETVDAYIKGTDSKNDLAVVGIKMENLKDSTKQAIRAIQMGDSDSLKLGEGVIAIGNALGIGQSVTVGCVSAVNREITTDENTTLTTIQTDAAINPGNSGGALLNNKGELVGINVAKSTEDYVDGMGFAIPISSARSIIEELTTMEPKVAVSEDQYPYMGVQLQDINSSIAATYGMPAGVMVYSVEENSPAAKAGLLAQDVITAFEGTTVETYNDLQEQLQYYAGGTTVTLTIQRLENGAYAEKEISLTLGLLSDYQSTTTQETTPETSEQRGGEGFRGFFGR